jgi:hypothetical protein
LHVLLSACCGGAACTGGCSLLLLCAWFVVHSQLNRPHHCLRA